MGHMIYEQGGVSQEAIDSMQEDGFDVVEMSSDRRAIEISLADRYGGDFIRLIE